MMDLEPTGAVSHYWSIVTVLYLTLFGYINTSKCIKVNGAIRCSQPGKLYNNYSKHLLYKTHSFELHMIITLCDLLMTP